MKRFTLLAAAAAIAITSTGVIATAQDSTPERGDGKRDRITMMFERFDTNGDGSVTRDEVAAVQADRFAETDANGDGQLSAEELAAAQDERRAERRQAGIERMIERLDENGDGVLSVEEAAAAGSRGDIFTRLDANEDGVITMAELEEARDDRRGGFGRGHGKGSWFGRGNH